MTALVPHRVESSLRDACTHAMPCSRAHVCRCGSDQRQSQRSDARGHWLERRRPLPRSLRAGQPTRGHAARVRGYCNSGRMTPRPQDVQRHTAVVPERRRLGEPPYSGNALIFGETGPVVRRVSPPCPHAPSARQNPDPRRVLSRLGAGGSADPSPIARPSPVTGLASLEERVKPGSSPGGIPRDLGLRLRRSRRRHRPVRTHRRIARPDLLT